MWSIFDIGFKFIRSGTCILKCTLPVLPTPCNCQMQTLQGQVSPWTPAEAQSVLGVPLYIGHVFLVWMHMCIGSDSFLMVHGYVSHLSTKSKHQCTATLTLVLLFVHFVSISNFFSWWTTWQGPLTSSTLGSLTCGDWFSNWNVNVHVSEALGLSNSLVEKRKKT